MTRAPTRVLGGVLGRPLWSAAIAASAGAGMIHLAHGPAHVTELGTLGAGFYVAAGLQLGWAALTFAALARSRTDSADRGAAALAASGIAINGGILAAWVLSRVVGLPAGEAPWTPERIGIADGVTAVLQGVLVVGLMASLRGWKLPRRAGVQRLATAAAAVAVLLIATGTAVATSPSEVGHAHQPGHESAAPGHHDVPDDPAEPDGRSDEDHDEDGGH